MGSEGGRSADTTDDSGPVKPGNGVEEKILMTRKEAWMSQQRRWGMGSRGREVMVTPMRSRHRVTGEKREPENRRGISEFHYRNADKTGSLEGHKESGSGQRATCNPAILNVAMGHGGQK